MLSHAQRADVLADSAAQEPLPQSHRRPQNGEPSRTDDFSDSFSPGGL